MTLAISPTASSLLEQVLLQGDLAKLSPADRLDYYSQLCRSLNLNPLTKPFEYLTLNGKLVLYARRDCTEQLRRNDSVSVIITGRETANGVYVVTAKATLPDGRTDESIGAVPIENLRGDALANAYMKAETKAKRRVTLSICGLGLLDEAELDTVPEARPVAVNHATGELPSAQNPPANRAAQPAQGQEHYCTIHKTAHRRFEKDGKVWYSHSLGKDANGKWLYCNEPKDAKPVDKPAPVSQTQAELVQAVKDGFDALNLSPTERQKWMQIHLPLIPLADKGWTHDQWQTVSNTLSNYLANQAQEGTTEEANDGSQS